MIKYDIYKDAPRCPGCNEQHPMHKLGCEVQVMQDKLRNARRSKGIRIHQRQDGVTWMVSMIHPNDSQKGSLTVSERGGMTPLQAAQGYLDDEDVRENFSALEMDLAIFCVVGQELAASGKQWKVYLFVLEDGELRAFP